MGRRLSIGPQYQPVQRSSLQLTRIVNAALGKVGDGADKPSAQKQIGVRLLPAKLKDIPLGIDVARHYHRPSAQLPSGRQNYVLDPAIGIPLMLSDDELFRSLPTSFSIFRIYSKSHENDAYLNAALNRVLGEAVDAKTNM